MLFASFVQCLPKKRTAALMSNEHERYKDAVKERFRSMLQDIKRRNANMLFHVMRHGSLVHSASTGYATCQGTIEIWQGRPHHACEACAHGGAGRRVSERLRAPECPRRCEVNRFLDEFLTARTGTDILSSQYLAITRCSAGVQVLLSAS